MTYVWDTNIFIKIVRNPEFLSVLNNRYDCFNASNEIYISAVTVGELHAFALRNGWGKKRIAYMKTILNMVKSISVAADNFDLIQMYSEIDVYSQSKHPTLRLPTSARKMGKNDLWIAATTAVHNATLISTDADFEHLDGVFITPLSIFIKISLTSH
jgi:tRNA(fMet)-specific endonuclease VapC